MESSKKLWLGGENHLKPVGRSIRVPAGTSFKIDPGEAEAALKQSELARLGELGRLRNTEAYHAALHKMSTGRREAHEAIEADPSLIAVQRPASPWPLRILVACMLLMFGTVLGLAWQVSRIGRSTLPSRAAETPSGGVVEHSRVEPTRQGRAVVAKSTHMRTGEP